MDSVSHKVIYRLYRGFFLYLFEIDIRLDLYDGSTEDTFTKSGKINPTPWGWGISDLENNHFL